MSRAGGHCFQLNPRDGIRRTFTGLKPNTWYRVGSETRLVDQRIEAEQYDGVQGSVFASSHRGENYIADLEDGEWVRYNEVDFGAAGKYDQLELTYSRPPGTQGAAPATLEVRSGNPTGVLLGEVVYNPAVVDSWFSAQIDFPPMSGVHVIYLLGKGPGADIMRLANVRLLNTNIPSDQKLTIGARNFGGSDTTTRIGEAFWRFTYETFSFRTGPTATSAEISIQNNCWYDAYLDRLALYETELPGANAAMAGGGAVTESLTDSWWQVDLRELQDIYEIRLTAPFGHP